MTEARAGTLSDAEIEAFRFDALTNMHMKNRLCDQALAGAGMGCGLERVDQVSIHQSAVRHLRRRNHLGLL